MSGLILPRRSFLIGLGAALAAPAIVRIENIMPVRTPPLLVSVSDFHIDWERTIAINRGEAAYLGETVREDPNVSFMDLPHWPKPPEAKPYMLPYKVASRREQLSEDTIKRLAAGGEVTTEQCYDGARLVQKRPMLSGGSTVQAAGPVAGESVQYTVPMSSFERRRTLDGKWAYRLCHPDIVFPGYAKKAES